MPAKTYDEKFWRDYLTHPDSMMAAGIKVLSRLPTDPRCRLCSAPFAGAGGALMRVIGRRQSMANPNYCNSCEKKLLDHHGGGEVDGSMLFADIRGSTTLAETMSMAEYRELLDRFYTTATQVVVAHDGMVDKFIGDELMAVFPPLLSADRHPARAVEAASALLTATGHADPGGPWVPLGAGVNTGRAWFGVVGDGSHVELTVVGDTVNVAARLASEAAVGEIVITVEAAEKAGLDPGLERRALQLKGKYQPTDVVTLRVESVAEPAAR